MEVGKVRVGGRVEGSGVAGSIVSHKWQYSEVISFVGPQVG